VLATLAGHWTTMATQFRALADHPFIVFIILVALSFDFLNGFHDAANSIATVVSTRVLSPGKAVAWAAFFNFVAMFIFGTAVAKTMGKGMIDLTAVTADVILAGLLGAIAWNVFTWYYGLPVSSSHALIGGYAGAAVAKAGIGVILPSGWTKTLAFIVIAPVLGLVVGFALMVAVSWIFRHWRPFVLDQLFRRLQLVSASFYSLGHGGNDAQKTMGIITGLMVAGGVADQKAAGSALTIPIWVIVACHAAMGLGTMFGGWRIVKTMGSRITKLQPFGGFCAETGGAITLFLATHLGIPVSTTHTITGAIVGVGSTRRISAVRWGVAGNIVWAWILTIPLSALVSALSFHLLQVVLPR
jgi:inorganic phosphate transporter, PiT family